MSKNHGQTLLEVIIAIALLALVLTVMVSTTVMSLANNRIAKERVVATRLAQSAQDWLRGQRDSFGWDTITTTFATPSVKYCFGNTVTNSTLTSLNTVSDTTPFSPCGGNDDEVTVSNTTYFRQLKIDDTVLDADQRNYTIFVYWYSSKSNSESVHVSGKLTNWN